MRRQFGAIRCKSAENDACTFIALGWWLVSTKVKEEGESGKVGRVPGDFLKRYDATDDHHNQSFINNESSGTRVSPKEILVGVTDPSMLYVAVEDYQAKDPGQIGFAEGAQLIVLELCEDGKCIIILWLQAIVYHGLRRLCTYSVIVLVQAGKGIIISGLFCNYVPDG